MLRLVVGSIAQGSMVLGLLQTAQQQLQQLAQLSSFQVAGTEFRSEEHRVQRRFVDDALPVRVAKARCVDALPDIVLSFDRATGVACVNFEASCTSRAFEASLHVLLRFGPTLRAVVLHVISQLGGSARKLQLGRSARARESLSRVSEVVHALSVPVVVVCSAVFDDRIGGSGLWRLPAAEYRVAGQHSDQCIFRRGSTSERAVCPRERARQFAAWLAHHQGNATADLSPCFHLAFTLLPPCSLASILLSPCFHSCWPQAHAQPDAAESELTVG